MKSVPAHLLKYVVDQNYENYTAEDQAVWRYIMRQLRDYLGQHAHSCYLEGLEKTGIEIERIPSIAEIDSKLRQFGWGAIPVSGFIPPAAFMEFQSLGFLPIAADIRTVEHILYTPAPDIVHEAAGHAPILVDPKFASYLKSYAEVAAHAIVSSEDMALYTAIRDLSDIKESPDSTPEQVREAEAQLEKANRNLSFVSEAARLGRMNWWTAEYGLIGTPESPRIFGAGLLSSLGESRSCLEPKVKKIPLSLECVNYSYDITEKQPQLFVTPDFDTLGNVLEELADTMAFRRGGTFGLDKAVQSKTVNTVVLNSGIQISGVLGAYLKFGDLPCYLKFSGPSQLSHGNQELAGHGVNYHKEGFGSPVGVLKGSRKCLSLFTDQDFKKFNIVFGQKTILDFESGVRVEGILTDRLEKDGHTLILTFKNCRVTHGQDILFDPGWGIFDMAVGSAVPSVFGGAADKKAFGAFEDFYVARVPNKKITAQQKRLFDFYSRIRDHREAKVRDVKILENLVQEYFDQFSEHWLPALELFEVMHFMSYPKEKCGSLEVHLKKLSQKNTSTRFCIEDGLRLLHLGR